VGDEIEKLQLERGKEYTFFMGLGLLVIIDWQKKVKHALTCVLSGMRNIGLVYFPIVNIIINLIVNIMLIII